MGKFNRTMSWKEPLAGKNTAKRRIQLRNFITDMSNAGKKYSDPFAQDENDSSQVLRVKNVKYSFKTDYIPESSSSDEEDRDGILRIKKKNCLDEADRVIAALKLPKVQKAEKPPQPQRVKVTSAHDLVAEFREQSQKLEKMRMVQAIGESEEDDLLI